MVYIGKGSIVPHKTQKWLYEVVKDIPLSEKIEISKKNGGYHAPFLPSSKPRKRIMRRLKSFIENVTDIHPSNDSK